MELTPKGREVNGHIRAKLLKRYMTILQKLQLSEKEVESIIRVLGELTSAYGEKNNACNER